MLGSEVPARPVEVHDNYVVRGLARNSEGIFFRRASRTCIHSGEIPPFLLSVRYEWNYCMIDIPVPRRPRHEMEVQCVASIAPTLVRETGEGGPKEQRAPTVGCATFEEPGQFWHQSYEGSAPQANSSKSIYLPIRVWILTAR